MSNYYHRDNKGNWSVAKNGILYPVEFSSSMECAYLIGKIDALEELKRETNETTLQIKDSQIREVDSASIPGE